MTPFTSETVTPAKDVVTRRTTMALAMCVASFGAAMGMRPSRAFAQDAEVKPEDMGEGKGEGKREGKGEGKGEGKREGKGEGKAAHFKFERGPAGDASIDVKCADYEPTQVCVDATSTLIDKISALPAPKP